MLLVIAVGAFVVPLLSERIGWFTAPSEMLYGTVVALLIPWARQPGPFILTLAHLGFLLLLFIAGMEIDFPLLRNRGPAAVLRAAAAAIGIQMLALAICLVLGWSTIYVMLTGAVSISILLVILQESQLTQTTFGQTLLITAAIGESLTIVEMTGYDLVQRHGFTLALGFAALKLLALVFVGLMVLRFLAVAVEQYPRGFQRLFASRDTTEVGVRAAFAFMLCFAAVAVLMNVDQILGAFMAGAISGYVFSRQQVVTRKLMTIGQGFFLPIFFVATGLQLNLLDVLRGGGLGLTISLVLVMLLVRVLAIPFLMIAGIPITSTPAAALLLASPLTLLVAIAQVGLSLGQLDASAHSAILSAAIAEAIIFPLGARFLLAGSAVVIPRQRMRSRLSHRLRAGTFIGRHSATTTSSEN
jgi:Kef-type K+ transport system membrane component KefB